jgi:hypothetical protein
VASPHAAPTADICRRTGRAIWMKNFGRREPPLNETSKALPRDPAFLAAAMEQPQPTFTHLKLKTPQTDDIAGNCVIVEVALNHAPQPLHYLRQRLMKRQQQKTTAKGPFNPLFQFGVYQPSDSRSGSCPCQC